MARVSNFETPKEAWELVVHYMSNDLADIALRFEQTKSGHVADREGAKDALYRRHTQLTGALSMISARLDLLGHKDDAQKVEKLHQMVRLADLTNKEVRASIVAKRKELNPR